MPNNKCDDFRSISLLFPFAGLYSIHQIHLTYEYVSSFIGQLQSINHNRIVFDSFNMAYRDEDSILDKIYRKQTLCEYVILKFRT